jgi:hypothetical protein
MKKALGLVSALIGVVGWLAAPPARAFVDATIEADIPFAFYAGDAQMPAGKYRLHSPEDSNGGLMEIRSDGSEGDAAIFQVFGTEARQPAGESELVFHKVGDNYYLWKIVEEGSPDGDEVPVSRSEKSLRRELSGGEREAVVSVPARSAAS